jgi:hypothetical protein
MNKNLLFFLVFVFLLSTNIIRAQNGVVKGRVVDLYGTPLPSVNVLEKGTVNGVSTDFDGNYSIKVGSSSVLVFSYVGFKSKEVAVDSQTTINVTLEESLEALDEVVVTALV